MNDFRGYEDQMEAQQNLELHWLEIYCISAKTRVAAMGEAINANINHLSKIAI